MIQFSEKCWIMALYPIAARTSPLWLHSPWNLRGWVHPPCREVYLLWFHPNSNLNYPQLLPSTGGLWKLREISILEKNPPCGLSACAQPAPFGWTFRRTQVLLRNADRRPPQQVFGHAGVFGCSWNLGIFISIRGDTYRYSPNADHIPNAPSIA